MYGSNKAVVLSDEASIASAVALNSIVCRIHFKKMELLNFSNLRGLRMVPMVNMLQICQF